jgi:hypothetical protein
LDHPPFATLTIFATTISNEQFGHVTAAVGEREREEKRSTFDLEPPIAGHQSFPKRFGGHGASRLCPPYAC